MISMARLRRSARAARRSSARSRNSTTAASAGSSIRTDARSSSASRRPGKAALEQFPRLDARTELREPRIAAIPEPAAAACEELDAIGDEQVADAKLVARPARGVAIEFREQRPVIAQVVFD